MDLPSIHKICAQLYGDPLYFKEKETDSHLMKTMRLPRREKDLPALVQSCVEHSKQLPNSNRGSVHVSMSKEVVESSLSRSKPGSSLILPSSKSVQQLHPRISQLKRDLREHRVDSDDTGRSSRADDLGYVCWVIEI